MIHRAAAGGKSRGGKPSSEYATWIAMKARCYNPKCRDFPDYGERGIEVCERWRNDFTAFLSDMGERPSKAHSLDREENDGPYSPDNCRWATKAEQSNNRRNNRKISMDGNLYSVLQFSTMFCHSPATVWKWGTRFGWDGRKILLILSVPRGERPKLAASL